MLKMELAQKPQTQNEDQLDKSYNSHQINQAFGEFCIEINVGMILGRIVQEFVNDIKAGNDHLKPKRYDG